MTGGLRQRIASIQRGSEAGVLVLSSPRGRLVPVTRAALDKPEDIERMTDWRNKHMKWFFTQFVATPAGTRKWLESEVLGKSTQLLYWVEWDGLKVGQVGWKIDSEDIAELDQFIRGESGGPANLMFMAEEALLDFLCNTAGCARILAKVLAGNLPALELHRAMAFEARRQIPVKAISTGGVLRFEPTADAGDNFVIELVLDGKQYRNGGVRG